LNSSYKQVLAKEKSVVPAAKVEKGAP
jgi:hypothetical protein